MHRLIHIYLVYRPTILHTAHTYVCGHTHAEEMKYVILLKRLLGEGGIV